MTTLKPTLRFSEFAENWEVKTLGDVSEIIMGQSPEGDTYNTIGNGVPLINGPVEFTEKYPVKIKWTSKPTKYCQDKDVLFCVRGSTTGRMNIANDRYCIGRGIAAIRANTQSISPFIELLLIKNLAEILSYTTGSTFQNIDSKSLKEFESKLPSLPEQTKIANFLTATDQKIETLKEKKSQIQQYKKGIMQQLFSQELRFKNINGEDYPDWKVMKLNQLLSEPKKRNYDLEFSREEVLSVSGEFGVVNQIGLLGRSYAGESIANYHVVRHNDIVYTKSPLKSNPYGIIKVNKGVSGIVSTLYAVYSCNTNLYGLYLDLYFQLDDNTNEYLRPLVRKGAKNDMKITNSHVLSGSITIPCYDEQIKIANFLTAIDEKIEKVNQQINDTQTFKKGLLQQMFC
jgi:type I restriction enzyme, S subunit